MKKVQDLSIEDKYIPYIHRSNIAMIEDNKIRFKTRLKSLSKVNHEA